MFAAAVSIAAGLGTAGTAAAAPLTLTEAEPIQDTGSAEGGTGSAELLPVLLPLLATLSAAPETPAAEPAAATNTGSAETLLPLLASLSAAAPE